MSRRGRVLDLDGDQLRIRRGRLMGGRQAIKPDIVTDHDFRYPVTEGQYEQSKYNDNVASGLVRLAHNLDLRAVAEKVRR